MKNYILLFLALATLFTGCTRTSIKTAEEAMRLTKSPAIISDDLDLTKFKSALIANINQLKLTITKKPVMTFGPKKIQKVEYIKILNSLVESLIQDPSGENFKSIIKSDFEFYEIYGKEKWGDAFITSYYQPIIKGSLKKTKHFSQAIYRLPEDMVTINLGEFTKTFKSLAPLKKQILEQKSRKSILRGRIIPSKGNSTSEILPYFSREEIDSLGKLEGRKLEIAWLSPLDSFFLQIQGSGTVKIYKNDKPTGEKIAVGYHSQNGHPYVAIGKHLLDVIPLEKMSMQAIEKYLLTLSPDEMQKVLNKNPSYVFFRKLKGDGITFFGTEVVAGRTIATDYGFFPKGALAYLEFEKPVFKTQQNKHNPETPKWKKTSRFVLDQDTGGAIRGPHRLDLYWGSGDKAARHAGIMKNWGKLYYLVPK